MECGSVTQGNEKDKETQIWQPWRLLTGIWEESTWRFKVSKRWVIVQQCSIFCEQLHPLESGGTPVQRFYITAIFRLLLLCLNFSGSEALLLHTHDWLTILFICFSNDPKKNNNNNCIVSALFAAWRCEKQCWDVPHAGRGQKQRRLSVVADHHQGIRCLCDITRCQRYK